LPSSSFDLSTFIAQLGRFVLRLGFWLIAAVAIVSLLIVSLGLLMLGLLRALITGRRPQPMMKFNFQSFKAGQGARFWPREHPTQQTESANGEQARAPIPSTRSPRRRLGADAGPVVDVEVREVPDQPRP
jgi:hypothetical protein